MRSLRFLQKITSSSYKITYSFSLILLKFKDMEPSHSAHSEVNTEV